MTEYAALQYRTWGDPELPPVVFLHGFMGSRSDWEAVAAVLQERFYCVAVDLPFHGASPVQIPSDDGFDHFSGALLRLADRLKLDRLALVGYSMGGRLALHCAAQSPERFYSLVLESASPGLKDPCDRDARGKLDLALAHELMGMAGQDAALREFFSDWYSQPIFSTLAARPDLIRPIIDARSRHDPRQYAMALERFSIARQPSHWDALKDWAVPTLCIVGEHDHKYTFQAEQMSEASPRIAVEIFAGCSHNVHLENAAGYTTSVNQFLDSTWKHA